jgi:hypothetical protein
VTEMPEHLRQRAAEARRIANMTDDELAVYRRQRSIEREREDVDLAATVSYVTEAVRLRSTNQQLRHQVEDLKVELMQARQELDELRRVTPASVKRTTTVMAVPSMPQRRQTSWWRKLLR